MRRVVSTVAVVALLATAGCVGSLPGMGGDGDGASGPDPVTHVPADVDAVVAVDAGVTEDENTVSLLNTLFESGETAPGDTQTLDEAVTEYQRQLNAELAANLSLDEINGMAAFSRTPDSPTALQGSATDQATRQYAGVVLSVGWDREDVLTNAREFASVSESEYGGVTVYEIVNETADSPVYGAEYEEGLWAFSANRTVVQDVIDVAQGEADSFGGDLQTAFDRTRSDAFVRYATTVSEQQRTVVRQYAALFGAQAPVDLTQFGDVTAYAGAYYSDGDQVGLSTYLTATNESSAQRLNETLGSLITLGQGTAEPGSTVEQQLEALSTDQDGQTLAITYEIGVEALQELIEEQATDTGAVPALAPATGAAATETTG
jgi:hypothetical protein